MVRVVRRGRQRTDLNLARFSLEGQFHLASAPMVAAVRAEPHAGSNRSYTNRESLCHGYYLEGS
jgi:hypothetical protein